jgi:hypothetical protein
MVEGIHFWSPVVKFEFLGKTLYRVYRVYRMALWLGLCLHEGLHWRWKGIHIWSPMVKFEFFGKKALRSIQTIQGGSRLRFVPTWEATLAMEGYTYLASDGEI